MNLLAERNGSEARHGDHHMRKWSLIGLLLIALAGMFSQAGGWAWGRVLAESDIHREFPEMQKLVRAHEAWIVTHGMTKPQADELIKLLRDEAEARRRAARRRGRE